MDQPQVVIDQEFRSLIPPLRPEERRQLEENIVREGCRDALVVWPQNGKAFILDGHTRYDICQARGKPYQTQSLDLSDRSAAKEWIIRNQFGRRNLLGIQRVELGRELEKIVAAKAKENQRIRKGNQRGTTPLNSAELSPVETRKEVASQIGIGHDTYDKGKVVLDKADPETLEKVHQGTLTINAAYKRVKEQEKTAAADEKRQAAAEILSKSKPKEDDFDIKHGDFREIAKTLPDESVDLIFTDPPYDRKSINLYGDVAQIASRVLCDGGSLICYLGHYLMKDVLDQISPHLRLWWILAVLHTGTKARMREYGIVVHWKPMLWFVKGTRGDKNTFVDDVVHSAQEKQYHEWQQSVLEAEYYIDRLCTKTGLVFDPFCGGGTTALACTNIGRRYITCDTDSAAVVTARKRICELKNA